MLAYKYMTIQGLDACLKHRTLRFTKPAYFNDPFDCAAAVDEPGLAGVLNVHTVGSTNADKLFQIRNAFGVLALTRNPLNLLMWAHYGSNHQGGVVAIDTEEAGLECPQKNVITAGAGDIIYTTVRPNVSTAYLPYHTDITSEHNRLMLEHLFLYKSLHWAYEEELRVVRRIDYTPQVRHQDFVIPTSAIKAVYLGAKYFHALVDDFDNKLPHVHWDHEGFNFYQCHLDPNTWNLRIAPYPPDV